MESVESVEQAYLEKDLKILKQCSLEMARNVDNNNGVAALPQDQLAQVQLPQVQLPQPQPMDQVMAEVEESPENEENLIKVDKKYASMRDIRLAAIEYGRRRKFAVSTLRSGARQLVLGCKHSGSYRGTKNLIAVPPTANTDATTAATTPTSTDSESPNLPAIELEEKVVSENPSQIQESTTATATQEPLKATQEQGESSSTLAVFPPAKRTRKKVTRKIQCPFQIRAKPIKGEQWVVYKMVTEHNHPMAAESILYAQHRKLDQETTQLIVNLMKQEKSNLIIIEELKRRGIRNVVKKDIANIRQTWFNPKNNKLSATGQVLYQVQQVNSSQVAAVASAQETLEQAEAQLEQTELQVQQLQQQQQTSSLNPEAEAAMMAAAAAAGIQSAQTLKNSAREALQAVQATLAAAAAAAESSHSSSSSSQQQQEIKSRSSTSQ